jgi:hypothetical protein
MEDVPQAIQRLILGIADEIVEVAEEKKRATEEISSGVVRRLILPLLQSQSIEPVSTLYPSSSSHIVQPKVLKQKKNDSCGYYALYNVVTIAAALTAPTEELALKHILSLRNRTKFWMFYQHVISHLYKRANFSKKYPWNLEHIDKGILERPYVQYLMDCKALEGNVEITVLSDFSMTGMKHNMLPIAEVIKLAQVFANYNDGDKKEEEKNFTKEEFVKTRVHAFLVGQLCHWISLVCVKFQGKVEVIVLDSRNHNLLTSTHEEFLRIVEKNKERIPDWKRHIFMCSLTEPKMTADLFHDCILGVRDIITSLLEHNMEGFLSSFEEYVEKSELKDVWLVPFISWLEMYWPPPVVEANIIKVLQVLGVSKLSPSTRLKFLRMANTVREGVGDFSECGIPVVQRFEVILQWLEMEFSALPEK